jgi:hypothetical protein
MMHRHESGPCDGAVWAPERRCTVTSHRITTAAHTPHPARELPVILWPFEITARIEARLRGWLHLSGRLPL